MQSWEFQRMEETPRLVGRQENELEVCRWRFTNRDKSRAARDGSVWEQQCWGDLSGRKAGSKGLRGGSPKERLTGSDVSTAGEQLYLQQRQKPKTKKVDWISTQILKSHNGIVYRCGIEKHKHHSRSIGNLARQLLIICCDVEHSSWMKRVPKFSHNRVLSHSWIGSAHFVLFLNTQLKKT